MDLVNEDKSLSPHRKIYVGKNTRVRVDQA